MSNQKICGVYHMWFGNRAGLYIGSSIDVHRRLMDHRRELEHRKCNPIAPTPYNQKTLHKQSVYNMHGLGPCYVRITCDSTELLRNEQEELDWWFTHHPDLVLNSQRAATRDTWADMQWSADEVTRLNAVRVRRLEKQRQAIVNEDARQQCGALRRWVGAGSDPDDRQYQAEVSDLKARMMIDLDENLNELNEAYARLADARGSSAAAPSTHPEAESLDDFLRRVL